MDLRGYGASDKPPRGYDTCTLAADVASVIRSLGETRTPSSSATAGAAGSPGRMPTLQPAVTRAVAALSMPHPLVLRRGLLHQPGPAPGQRLPRRAAAAVRARAPDDQRRRRTSSGCCARGPRPAAAGPPPRRPGRYADAMALPFVAHSAAEYYRWVVRSQVRPDGRRFVAPDAHARSRCRCCSCTARLTARCPAAPPPRGSAAYVAGPFEEHLVAGRGALPARGGARTPSTAHLTRWLDRLG